MATKRKKTTPRPESKLRSPASLDTVLIKVTEFCDKIANDRASTIGSQTREIETLRAELHRIRDQTKEIEALRTELRRVKEQRFKMVEQVEGAFQEIKDLLDQIKEVGLVHGPHRLENFQGTINSIKRICKVEGPDNLLV